MEIMLGALKELGPFKLLFAQAATTGLWESEKKNLIGKR